jgi:hypothetical protein
MSKRFIRLEKSGDVTCLRCNAKLRYGPEAGVSRCDCENLAIQDLCLYEYIGDHDYAIVPDYYGKIAKRQIFVDVDKTLSLTNEYPFLGEINKPLADVLYRLHVAGYSIVAYSCRTNPDIVGGAQEAEWQKLQIQRFLNDNNIGWFVRLYEGAKPYSAFLIDDKATGYQALVSILRGIENMQYLDAMEESEES